MTGHPAAAVPPQSGRGKPPPHEARPARLPPSAWHTTQVRASPVASRNHRGPVDGCRTRGRCLPGGHRQRVAFLYGTDQADTILGLGGNDSIYGQKGADTLVGGAGRDRLNGSKAPDRIEGRLGADTLYGGDGIDTVIGGPGDDHIIVSGDGDVNTVSCGDGIDSVIYGPEDVISPRAARFSFRNRPEPPARPNHPKGRMRAQSVEATTGIEPV